MNFDLSESQTLFRDTIARFCSGSDVAARHAARKLPGGFDRARWTALAELGLIGLAVSEAEGGLGGSLLDCAVAAQALGKGLAVEPWLECGFLPARLLAGTAHLADVASGARVAAFAFAEAGHRYALDARTTTARAGRLSGEKTFVPGGGAADIFVVSALVDGDTQLFAIEREQKGVDVKPYRVADGSLSAVLSLRDADAGEPLPAMMTAIIEEARLIAAAEMAGVAQRLFDDTLDYVKTREQFGQPLGRFQVIQHRLVDAYAKVEQVQSALYRALLQPGVSSEAVKAFISEEAIWIGHQAVQLHGGMGMTDELAIGHGLKRILLLSRLFGDPAGGVAAHAKAA